MTVNIFLLGRPGCGKSSAARYVSTCLQSKGWLTKRFMDFNILLEMTQEEIYKQKFNAVQKDRFDVAEDSVLIEALQRLNGQIMNYMKKAQSNEIIFIEFARDNYEDALTYFSSDVLQNAYFLFIDVDLNICIERIERRMAHPSTPDDHYVSKEMLMKYYVHQEFPLNRIQQGKFILIDNNDDSLQDFIQKIDNVAKDIFK